MARRYGQAGHAPEEAMREPERPVTWRFWAVMVPLFVVLCALLVVVCIYDI